MFVDKQQTGTVTVARVSRFFSQNEEKKSDTVDTLATVHAYSNMLQSIPDGYIVAIETATGTWYYGGRSVDGSVFGWTQYLRKAWIYPAEYATGGINQIVAAIKALVGDQAIVKTAVLPIRRTPIDRCEIIEDQQP